MPINPRPTTLIPITVRIDGVLDLFDPLLLRRLRTSTQELTGEWRYSQALGIEPATQRLGRLAHKTGRIKAIRYPSAKAPDQACLAVFVERLTKSASHDLVAVVDPAGSLQQSLP